MLACQKQLFDLPNDVSYLNCSYMSPLLRTVADAGVEGIRRKVRPYEIKAADFYTSLQSLRQAFAGLINASDENRIAIIPSASYGVASVCRNLSLQVGDEILVAEEQFPSNYYSWQRLAEASGAVIRNVKFRAEEWTPDQVNERLLQAITNKTAVVALGQVHWADGLPFDLLAIRQQTREVGSLLVIDGTQSVGALPFDVNMIQPDALICAGYKWLLGPYSLGCAYFGPYFDAGTPIEENWINRYNSEDFSQLVNYEDQYKPLAWRFSVGEGSNFILSPMLEKAIKQILEWGVVRIQEYCRSISRPFVEEMRSLNFRVHEEQYRCGHLFGVLLPKEFDLPAFQKELMRHRVFVSVRGNSVRISPHLYNDQRDFDKLLTCFRTVSD